ncbi:MAG: hypothetical protein IT447_05525 [Phycisphaerales bacterium]|jgi:hypothetical protein|nr:hypothetical protein [Phycisphaerales bacterium]
MTIANHPIGFVWNILFILVMSPGLVHADIHADEPDLTFLLTFDKNSVVADYARGNRASTTFHDNLEFRTFPGVNGGNAFNIKEGETLKYDVANNIDHRQGTLAIWLMANNYDPKDVGPTGQQRSHKSYVNVMFKNGNDWVRFFLYEYCDTETFFFYWHNSWCGPQMYKTAGAPATDISRKQWFHLAITWTLERIQIYLNGDLRGEVRLPEEAKLARNLNPSPKESFIGVRDRLWATGAVDAGKETVVDDMRIYSRPLSAIEIKRLYLQSAPDTGAAKQELPNIDIQLNGVDDGVGSLDRLRADLNYHPLSEQWRKAIAVGKVTATGTIRTPAGQEITEQWQPSALDEYRIFRGVDTPGEHTFTLTLTDAQGRTEKAEKKITRPNTEWFDYGIGQEDEIPSPWTALTVSDDNSVEMWGRRYEFGDHPLPRKIIHTGDSILAESPELVVETAAGPADIKYIITGREIHKSYVEFTGTGTARDFSLSWNTRVDFDGLVRWDFTVHGRPLVRSMKLTWTVNRKFAGYLLDPLLLQSGNGKIELPFPSDAVNSQHSTVLWLTSDKKGFCWVPEHDANWVYDRKPIKVETSDTGGRCTLSMIQKPVRIPEGAAYHAMFVATPSRPLPKVSRTYRIGGFGRQSNCDVSIEHEGGDGLESRFTFRPAADFSDYVNNVIKARGVKRAAVYGAPTSLNDICPEGVYFRTYWDIPGGPSYPLETRGVHYQSTNTCPHTRFSDYILWNIRLLFNHPDQMTAAIYYDLVLNYTCANPLHGCSFKDAFGRSVNRLIVMGLRQHLMRTLKYCHKSGRDVILHAHSYYNPAFDVFGDYWFPGEQYGSIMQNEGPYFYSDKLPDDIYRSELNKNIKGSAVVFTGSLKRANPSYGTEEQTLAMLTKLLLNDISVAISYEDESVINRIWGIALKYKLDDAEVVFFYDPANAIKSNNTNIVTTYYRCADGRILAIVGNMTREDQSAEIDLGSLKAGLTSVHDEYADEMLDAAGGIIQLNIKARQFRIIGF